jgi:hypothetical protein
VYLYDLRRAPFQELIAGAAGTSLSTGLPPRHTLVRVGLPFFPKVVRYVLCRGVTAPPA